MTESALVSERDLARTYDGGTYDDASEIVHQYRRVKQYQADNPEKGYTAIASQYELPAGRVRSWYEGKIPNVINGLETARDYNWLNVTYDDPEFEALNTLSAAIYSGGSINGDNWSPKWTLNEHGYHSEIVNALERAGVGHVEHEPETETSAPVIRAETDGAILGRVLHALGTPIGKKSELDDFSLPWYLDDAPRDVRESFVRTYVHHRGYEDSESDAIQILEKRTDSYLRELAALIESVADAPVRAGDGSVTISAEAARALELSPRYNVQAES